MVGEGTLDGGTLCVGLSISFGFSLLLGTAEGRLGFMEEVTARIIVNTENNRSKIANAVFFISSTNNTDLFQTKRDFCKGFFTK
jgi:hypothetical protein